MAEPALGVLGEERVGGMYAKQQCTKSTDQYHELWGIVAGWRVIAAPQGEWRGAMGAMRLYQDAALLNAREMDGARERSYELGDKRAAYVHVALGSATVNGVALQAGDALKIWDEPKVEVVLAEQAQVLLFDLPRD